MKKLTWFVIPAILALQSASAVPQKRWTYPPQPESMNSAPPASVPATPQRHIDLLQLQRDANDLSLTAQTIPSDVESIRKGMLPKDVIQKLKQIEKLSKRLRSELNP